MFRLLLLILIPLVALTSCYRVSPKLEPKIATPMHPRQVEREQRVCLNLPDNFSTSPFAPLTPAEKAEEWGKELMIAHAFAEDFDLYRAITGFKRALYLLPPDLKERRLEIEYDVALAYYLGQKYVEVIHAVEATDLVCVDNAFPAFSDLLLILYDSYKQLGREEQACHILALIEKKSPHYAEKLTLLSAVQSADLPKLSQSGCDKMVSNYCQEAKSIRKAKTLNAILPGAGYWYVGLKETAITSVLINALFIGTGVYFIDRGNIPAAAVVLSLESGWYFGGIYGAGLAAKRYNEHLYEGYANNITKRDELFPSLMLRYTF